VAGERKGLEWGMDHGAERQMQHCAGGGIKQTGDRELEGRWACHDRQGVHNILSLFSKTEAMYSWID